MPCRNPFQSYDPIGPIRDPRTKGLSATRDALANDMGSCIARIVRNTGGSCHESDLIAAGFTLGEIGRVGDIAQVKAREILAPVQIRRPRGVAA